MFHYQTFFLLEICSLLDCYKQTPEKKFGGHPAHFREKERGKLFRFVRARAHLRANDAKIVRSRDAQCNTKELP